MLKMSPEDVIFAQENKDVRAVLRANGVDMESPEERLAEEKATGRVAGGPKPLCWPLPKPRKAPGHLRESRAASPATYAGADRRPAPTTRVRRSVVWEFRFLAPRRAVSRRRR